MSAAPPATAWPRHFATPREVLAWLNTLQARDGLTGRCLLAMRWLVLAELDRTASEPAPRAITDFVPDAPPFSSPLRQPHEPPR